MTTQEKVSEKLAAFDKLMARRCLLDIEQSERGAYVIVAQWFKEEAEETARIEAEAAAAEEQERLNSPEQQTKDLFNSYRSKLKKEGRMR